MNLPTFTEHAIRWLQAKEAYPWMDHSETLIEVMRQREDAILIKKEIKLGPLSIRLSVNSLEVANMIMLHEFSAIEREFGRRI